MFHDKDAQKIDGDRSRMGRVIDLRKGAADAVDVQRPTVAAGAVPPSKGGSAVFGFFKRKRNDINFLRNYTLQEKEEEFIEQELMREYLEEEEESRKKEALAAFFALVFRQRRLWWLPLSVMVLSWRIFWVFGRNRASAAKAIPNTKEVEPQSVSVPDVAHKTKVVKEPAWATFLSSLFSWPRSIMAFLSGRTTEDYLYQRVLLDDIARTKFNPFRHFALFAAMVFVVLLPIKVLGHYKVVDIEDFKGRVLGVSERAVGNLGSAADSVSALNFSEARDSFSLAKENFSQAKRELEDINAVLLEIGKVIPNKKVRFAAHGKDFLAAGEAGASLGENLSAAAAAFTPSQGKKLSEMIEDFLKYEKAALTDARALNASLSKIDPSVIPKEYQVAFSEMAASGRDLEALLAGAYDIAAKANVFLGAESDKRYLFVFENNSEMRASGGFIGSFALVDFSQGKIKNIEVPGGGSYDTESELKKFIVAPEPLWLVNPLWHFWDANWWPDWQKSAKKLSWFYEKSGGPTVDGVIAFTPTVLERLLSVIGPIDMTEEYGVIVDSENLWVSLRDIIEKEKLEDQDLPNEVAEKKPKRVIGYLFGRIMEELPKRLNQDNFPKLIAALSDSFDDKQVLFYFADGELQAEVEKRNWAGRIKETGKDYLYVVNTNIAGGKSDGKMEEEISHQAEIEEDGSIVDTLVIKKKHTGVVDEPYFGVRNVNWLRVYVPAGSQLLEASGFRGPDSIYFETPEAGWETDLDVAYEEGDNASIDQRNLNTKIYQESGKTVFANWVMVDPGQEAIIRLKYRLPFKLEKKVLPAENKGAWDELIDKFIKTEEKKDIYAYSLMVQKQPGMRFSTIKSTLKVPDNFDSAWKYPTNLPAGDGWKIEESLASDKYWAVLLEKDDLGN